MISVKGLYHSSEEEKVDAYCNGRVNKKRPRFDFVWKIGANNKDRLLISLTRFWRKNNEPAQIVIRVTMIESQRAGENAYFPDCAELINDLSSTTTNVQAFVGIQCHAPTG